MAAQQPTSQAGERQINHLPLPLLLTSVIVLLGSLGIITWFILNSDPKFQYPMVASIVCFVISVISSLLLFTKVDVRGSFAGLAVFVGGPGASWLIALYVFTKLFPMPVDTNPPNGWISFEGWENKLDRKLEDVFLKNEDEELQTFLRDIYAPGIRRNKPINTEYTSLLYYFEDGRAIQLVHISGDTINGEADIFNRAKPTNPASKIYKRVFLKYKNSDDYTPINSDDEWYSLHGSKFDFYSIIAYDEPISNADYIIYEIPEYANNRNKIKFNQCIASSRKIKLQNVNSWEIGPAPITVSGTPLWVTPDNSIPTNSFDDSSIINIKTFLVYLNRLVKTDNNTDAITEALKILRQGKGSTTQIMELTNGVNFQDIQCHIGISAHLPRISFIQWGI